MLIKIATQWSFFFLQTSWLMLSCIHWDRELHGDQNHNIIYRKTCTKAQILATFRLGKLKLNYKMSIWNRTQKSKKKKVDSSIASRHFFQIRCCYVVIYDSFPPTIISVFGSLQFLSLRDKRFPRVNYHSAVKFGTKAVFFGVIIRHSYSGAITTILINKSLEPEHKTPNNHVLFSI